MIKCHFRFVSISPFFLLSTFHLFFFCLCAPDCADGHCHHVWVAFGSAARLDSRDEAAVCRKILREDDKVGARETGCKRAPWWLDVEKRKHTGWRSSQLRTGNSPLTLDDRRLGGHNLRLEFCSGNTGSEFGVNTMRTWIHPASYERSRFLFSLHCQPGCCVWLCSHLHDHRGPSSAGSTGRKMYLRDCLLTIFVLFCVLEPQLQTTFSKFNTKSIKFWPGHLQGPLWMCGTVVCRAVVEIWLLVLSSTASTAQ